MYVSDYVSMFFITFILSVIISGIFQFEILFFIVFIPIYFLMCKLKKAQRKHDASVDMENYHINNKNQNTSIDK